VKARIRRPMGGQQRCLSERIECQIQESHQTRLFLSYSLKRGKVDIH
jgi:hypothetical protein